MPLGRELDDALIVKVKENLPAKEQRAKLLAAIAEAAYWGYASTRNVKIPVKTRSILEDVS